MNVEDRLARVSGRSSFTTPMAQRSSSISTQASRRPAEVPAMARVMLDHLVVAAATLEQGEDYVEARVGIRPKRGGQHVAMGTHNSVLRLGERVYLEVIAVDPQGCAPAQPRWFELDQP